jgi:hypothetical protein
VIAGHAIAGMSADVMPRKVAPKHWETDGDTRAAGAQEDTRVTMPAATSAGCPRLRRSSGGQRAAGSGAGALPASGAKAAATPRASRRRTNAAMHELDTVPMQQPSRPRHAVGRVAHRGRCVMRSRALPLPGSLLAHGRGGGGIGRTAFVRGHPSVHDSCGAARRWRRLAARGSIATRNGRRRSAPVLRLRAGPGDVLLPNARLTSCTANGRPSG